MKTGFLLLINIFFAIVVHAQTKPQAPLSIKPYDSLLHGRKFLSQKFKWNDSLATTLRKKYFSDETPPPGSMRKGFVFPGNNQNGFDVYQTLQDNMFILKPDSTFVSNMPVIKMPSTERMEPDDKKN